jgi:chaperone LolA
LTRLQQRYDCSRSMQANFDETLSSPGGLTRTRKGTVYFRKVGRMRWEFAAPSEGAVVSDGKTVYDYEKDLNQVVELPVNQALKSSATAFLLGLGNIRRDFKVTLPPASSSDGLTHVILTPKGGGDTMELGLDPKSYDIVNFKLTNQVGGVTELKFSDIRTNVALDDTLFTFTVPEGADIVRPQKN